jgi:hypothetical protein
MPQSDYLLGLAFVTVVYGCVAASATVVLRRRLPHLRGAVAAVAWGVIATFALIAVHVVPLTLGILSRETAAAGAAAGLAVALAIPRRMPAPAQPAGLPAATGAASRWMAIATAAALAIYLIAVLRSRLFMAPTGVDTLTFHLPNVARWIESGSLWQIDQFIPLQSHGHYPHNGDIVLLSTILPWSNDFLAHQAMAPFLAMTAVAVYALGRELRASWPAAVGGACLVAAVPIVTVPALATTLVDAVMLGPFAAGVLFLARHLRSGQTTDLVLAGLGLGVAFGTKWYAVASVAGVVDVWAVARLAPPRPRARRGRGGGCAGGGRRGGAPAPPPPTRCRTPWC